MTDKFSVEVRSGIMSKIKSKWTKPERKLHNLLKGNKIKHTMHPSICGNPDVLLKDFNTLIFIDGCFWHYCPIHGHIPTTNKDYWDKKISRNIERDKKTTKKLKGKGYIVLRLWECEVMQNDFEIKAILDKTKK